MSKRIVGFLLLARLSLRGALLFGHWCIDRRQACGQTHSQYTRVEIE
jgi:hypothetical protein